jgi:hypothetical protein
MVLLTRQQHKWKSCERKNGYSLAVAEQVKARQFRETGTLCKVYLCQYCQKWHLTHTSQPQRYKIVGVKKPLEA